MTFAWKTLIATVIGANLIALSAYRPVRPDLVWNASASVPIGLYRVSATRKVMVRDLVVVRPPPALADFLADGHYLPRGVPILKPVAALAGDVVCRNGAHIVIDGRAVAEALPRDRRGRLLPRWQGCVTLNADQVFLLNPDRPDSLDGRYFGPLALSTVVGRATPIWTKREPS
jgi:conjugative transfer signal peptidase TraF